MLKTDQLIGLCDEMAALVRLNIPLEEALRLRSRDLPAKLGNRVKELAEKLEAGQSLAETIKNDKSFPPAYAAVIEAGLESGNLAGTLELVAQNVRTLRDSRNFLIGATYYPMLVFSVLWVMLSGVLFLITPAFVDFYHDFSFSLPLLGPVLEKLALCREFPMEYGGVMLLVLILVWAIHAHWVYHSSRSVLLTFRPAPLFFWLRSANKNLAQATFAQVAALLVRSNLPLHRVLWLASRTVDDPAWNRESEIDFEKINWHTGNNSDKKSPLTPLMRWMAGIPDRDILLDGLTQYAEMSTFRAKSQLERLELWLPVLTMSAEPFLWRIFARLFIRMDICCISCPV